jgi:GntR family transcriptional regulator
MSGQLYNFRMSWDAGVLVSGPLPLWAQIASRLRADIENEVFQIGEEVPSETRLVSYFGVSRATARTALNQLAVEGLVERLPGKGTLVCKKKFAQPLNRLASFNEDIKAKGMVPGYRDVTVSIENLSSYLSDKLGVKTSQPALRIERLLLADKNIVAHSISWISPVINPSQALKLSKPLESSSLYAWLEKNYALRIAHGVEEIEAKIADPVLAEKLNVPPGSAILNTSRVAYASTDVVIEYSIRQYRADLYKYWIELVRE